jgi:uncharacterized membrane protein
MLNMFIGISEIYKPTNKFNTIGDLVNVILPNVYMLAGVILFILLLFGGFGVIMGAGNDDPKQAASGRQATMAVIGFLVIFASFWIIRIIETLTGVKIFESNI